MKPAKACFLISNIRFQRPRSQLPLSISKWRIGDKGFILLVEALATNTSLKVLEVPNNNISDVGVTALLDLVSNTTLAEVNLHSNNISAHLLQSVSMRFNPQTVPQKNKYNQREKASASKHVVQPSRSSKQKNIPVKVNRRDFEKAYDIAQRNGDGVHWRRGKLMLVGQGGSGKTSTVRSFVGVEPVSEHLSTLGGELTQATTLDWSKVDAGDDLKIAIHRVAASRLQDSGSSPTLRLSLTRGAKNKIQKVRHSLKKYVSKLRVASEDESKPSAVQSKQETPETSTFQSEPETIMEFDEKLVIQEQSGSRPLTITFWDFGGQKVFYSLHHIFLTRYGIYMVVFDMRKFQNSNERVEAIEYVEFWLHSIKSHAPNAKVVLIGTHFDSINNPNDLEMIDEVLANHLDIEESLGSSLLFNKAQNHFFFPINNSSQDPNRALILRNVLESAFEDEKYIKESVSLRWIQALDAMRRHGMDYLEVASDVRSICSLFGIGEAEQEDMLVLFHRLGMFVYLDMSDVLRSRVVINPQWLINMLTKVIRDSSLHLAREEKLEIKTKFMSKKLSLLLQTGYASEILLRHFFGQDFEYLVEFMENSLLLSKTGAGNYIVPSLALKQPIKCPANINGSKCWLRFQYLPEGLFQRFICVCAADRETDATARVLQVHHSHAVFSIGKTDIFAIAKGNDIILRFGKTHDDEMRVRNKLYRLVQVISMKFLGSDLKTPQLFLVPRGYEDEIDPIGATFEIVQEILQDPFKSLIRLSNEDLIPKSIFELELQHPEFNRYIEIPKRFDSFFSYSWGDDLETRDAVRRIHYDLSSDLNLWLDDDMMIGDISSSMADGIDCSDSAVVFVTESYIKKINSGGRNGTSDNCFKEFNYAARHGSEFLIPVVLDSKVLDQKLWTGKFGADINLRQKYIDFTDPAKYNSNLKILAAEIKRRASNK